MREITRFRTLATDYLPTTESTSAAPEWFKPPGVASNQIVKSDAEDRRRSDRHRRVPRSREAKQDVNAASKSDRHQTCGGFIVLSRFEDVELRPASGGRTS